MNVLAWSTTKMSGIDPNFLCHRLAIDPRTKPIIQKQRVHSEKKEEGDQRRNE